MKPQWRKSAVRALATGAVAIGTLGLLGYLLRLDGLFRWLGDYGMAFNTSIGFLFAGLALLILTDREA